MHSPRLLMIVVIVLLATGLAAQAGLILPYQFTINPATSGLDANTSFAALTDGTLIGNWDPKTNPTGTRTKPGLFGSFGENENVPVPTSIGFGVGGAPQSATSGSFQMTFDLGAGGLVFSQYSSNFLASGPLALPATLTLEYDSFRTRNPTSTFIGGIPLPIPVGDATLSALSVVQAGPSAFGTLTPIGGNQYAFAVAPLVILTATFSILGNEFTIPSAPTPLVLDGEVVIDGETAQLTSVRRIEFAESLPIGQALPEIPFDLPTILPPGATAHLLLNLTLTEIIASLDGTLTTRASGVYLPEPVTAALLLPAAAAVLGFRRRARR